MPQSKVKIHGWRARVELCGNLLLRGIPREKEKQVPRSTRCYAQCEPGRIPGAETVGDRFLCDVKSMEFLVRAWQPTRRLVVVDQRNQEQCWIVRLARSLERYVLANERLSPPNDAVTIDPAVRLEISHSVSIFRYSKTKR